LLKVRDLNVHYGGIHAIRGIDIDVEKGSIVTIIGSNGAGKSSTLNAISGVVKYQGLIELNGEKLPTHPNKVVQKGVVQVPEGRLIFANLTVEENLRMGAYLRNDAKGIKEDFEHVYDLFPRLKEREKQRAGTLSGGEQQMLAVGRALMSRPKIIMMDEPSLGLAPLIVKGIFDIIREINKQGVTVLLIEQNANMALKTADWAYVMETGRITMSGTGKELLENDDVKAAYLGSGK